jgi:HSP20 family protein
MKTLTHWNPFQEMEDLSNRLSSGWGLSPSRSTDSPVAGTWTPRVDVTEDEKEYRISAELPAVEKADVSVTVEDGILSIEGERKFEQREDGPKYHRVERVYGKFERRFHVPKDADAKQIAAEFKNGVLDVRLAKLPEAKPRQIDVKFE